MRILSKASSLLSVSCLFLRRASAKYHKRRGTHVKRHLDQTNGEVLVYNRDDLPVYINAARGVPTALYKSITSLRPQASSPFPQ